MRAIRLAVWRIDTENVRAGFTVLGDTVHVGDLINTAYCLEETPAGWKEQLGSRCTMALKIKAIHYYGYPQDSLDAGMDGDFTLLGDGIHALVGKHIAEGMADTDATET